MLCEMGTSQFRRNCRTGSCYLHRYRPGSIGSGKGKRREAKIRVIGRMFWGFSPFGESDLADELHSSRRAWKEKLALLRRCRCRRTMTSRLPISKVCPEGGSGGRLRHFLHGGLAAALTV